MNIIMSYLVSFLAILVVLPLHEYAHAFAAVRSGDDTPKYSGRYTLNPFAHFDVLGLITLVLCGFGWAKPVPVNPYNFKNYKKGCIWVSISGVLANIITAFLIYPIILLVGKLYYNFLYAYIGNNVFLFNLFIAFFGFLRAVYSISIGLFVFNLLPLYPLDGFRLLDALLTKKGKVFRFLRDYGNYVLLAIIILSFLPSYVNLPFFNLLATLRTWVGKPIELFWGLFIK